MHKFKILFLVLLISGCAHPTTRLPSTAHYGRPELTQIRRQFNSFAYKYNKAIAKRVNTIHYNIVKSTGEELCDRKLIPDIGLVYVKVGDFTGSKFFNPNYEIEKDMADDNKALFAKNVREIIIQQVIPGSAADKAGIKEGDVLVSLYGVPAPSGEEAFRKLSEIIENNNKAGLPVDIEVERQDKVLKFSLAPDMVCPYPLMLDSTSHQINAFADGDHIYVTLELVDYIQDDDLLAAAIAHELAHNTFGHSRSKGTNEVVGVMAGAVSDIFLGTSGATQNLGESARKLYSKEFELEADYVSVYYVARAGYDYHKMGDLQKMLVNRDIMSLYVKGDSHPRPQDRFALLTEAAKEVDLKKAFKEELVPDFKEGNNYLKDKKD